MNVPTTQQLDGNTHTHTRKKEQQRNGKRTSDRRKSDT